MKILLIFLGFVLNLVEIIGQTCLQKLPDNSILDLSDLQQNIVKIQSNFTYNLCSPLQNSSYLTKENLAILLEYENFNITLQCAQNQRLPIIENIDESNFIVKSQDSCKNTVLSYYQQNYDLILIVIFVILFLVIIAIYMMYGISSAVNTNENEVSLDAFSVSQQLMNMIVSLVSWARKCRKRKNENEQIPDQSQV